MGSKIISEKLTVTLDIKKMKTFSIALTLFSLVNANRRLSHKNQNHQPMYNVPLDFWIAETQSKQA